MQNFTNQRDEATIDEIWLLEHTPVFTQGQNGKTEHVLNSGNIPVIQSDRGGQVTYHGPGQLMIYTLMDIKRKKLTIRQLVSLLEQSVIDYLATLDLKATAKREAPGVYINADKICSIGLRIRKGFSYHGMAFNINMDLEPFKRINPCGFAGLNMTQLAHFTDETDLSLTGKQLVNYLMKNLGYTSANYFLETAWNKKNGD